MRSRHAVLVALLVALAGCSAGYVGDTSSGDAATPDATAGTPADGQATAPTDPETDTLGWEGGYWANETISLDRSDGLNETERDAVVARSMARVERVRRLEFTEEVPVELVSRAEYRNNTGGYERGAAFRAFDNAKFEALFLVGEDTDSLAVQSTNRGSSVAGFYVPGERRIVVIYSGDTPDLPGEATLSHELTHALQDQHFDLTSITASTREESNANNGLIEGDANLVRDRYMANCGDGWSCLSPPESDSEGGGGDFHLGIYILNFFPYSDGPGFVNYYQQRSGWEQVNAMYSEPPASTEQVITPAKYAVDPDPPTTVRIGDAATNGWERVRPERRDDAASLGQSAIVAMFAYTLYDDYNGERSVVRRDAFLNLQDGEVDRSDPFDYGIDYADGWDGDRMHVYQKDGETAYVWKITWDSPDEASEFATGYRALLDHWGATEVRDGVYRIDNGPYVDSFRLIVDGDTVTIVNAPSTAALDDVYGR